MQVPRPWLAREEATSVARASSAKKAEQDEWRRSVESFSLFSLFLSLSLSSKFAWHTIRNLPRDDNGSTNARARYRFREFSFEKEERKQRKLCCRSSIDNLKKKRRLERKKRKNKKSWIRCLELMIDYLNVRKLKTSFQCIMIRIIIDAKENNFE